MTPCNVSFVVHQRHYEFWILNILVPARKQVIFYCDRHNLRIIIGYVLFFTLLYFPNCWTALLRWGYGNSETLSTQSRKRLIMVWYAGASAGASRCYLCVNLLSLFCCSGSFCCRKTFLAFHALGPYLHFTTLCPFKKKKKKKKGIWKQASFTHKAKIGLCPKCVRVCMYWYVCRSV